MACPERAMGQMESGYFKAVQYDLEDLLRELSEQCLAIRRGLSEQQRTGAIYASHPVATDLESICWVRQLAETEVDPDLREQAARVYFGCVGQFIRMDLLLRDEALAQFMVEARVQMDGQSVSLAEMEGWLMAEDDFSRREALRLAARPLLHKASLIKATIWEGATAVLQEDFGYKDYLHFYQEKKGVDISSLVEECKEFLEATDAVYWERVVPWAEASLGRTAASVSHLHMIRLLQLDRFWSGMRTRGIMPVLGEVLEALGLSKALHSRIRLDDEARPKKSVLPRCVPLRVPDEIHVTLKPLGGLADLEAALHELGHALQLAYADPALPYPYRHLPRSYALSECFGFLLEGLTREPEFLANHTDLPGSELEALCREKALKRLYVIRRYAGKLIFEQEFLSEGQWLDWSAYPRRLSRATGFLYEPHEALMDLEEELYAADYLRAWAAEVLLKEHLRDRFGRRWFASREAGSFLRELWDHGEYWDLEDLLASIGLGPLSLRVLANELLLAPGCS